MKIKGPGGAPPPPPEPTETGAKDKVAGGGFADALRGGAGAAQAGAVGGAPAATGPQGAQVASGADPVAQVAADLKAGALSPKQAVDRLVELTIERGAGAHLPADVKAKLRAQLETLVAEDPVFTGKTSRLGGE